MNAAEYYRSVKDDRQAWRDSTPAICMHCCNPEDWNGLQTHEIERRSQAQRTWGHRCNYLLLCERCHAGPFAAMPHSQQLAIKLIRDPNYFDLKEWLRLKDPELKAPERVTLSEVVAHLAFQPVFY